MPVVSSITRSRWINELAMPVTVAALRLAIRAISAREIWPCSRTSPSTIEALISRIKSLLADRRRSAMERLPQHAWFRTYHESGEKWMLLHSLNERIVRTHSPQVNPLFARREVRCSEHVIDSLYFWREYEASTPR